MNDSLVFALGYAKRAMPVVLRTSCFEIVMLEEKKKRRKRKGEERRGGG